MHNNTSFLYCDNVSTDYLKGGFFMELKKLIYTVNEDGIAVITMNYMKNLNAIDEQMADELMYVVDAAEKDPNVKVVAAQPWRTHRR